MNPPKNLVFIKKTAGVLFYLYLPLSFGGNYEQIIKAPLVFPVGTMNTYKCGTIPIENYKTYSDAVSHVQRIYNSGCYDEKQVYLCGVNTIVRTAQAQSEACGPLISWNDSLQWCVTVTQTETDCRGNVFTSQEPHEATKGQPSCPIGYSPSAGSQKYDPSSPYPVEDYICTKKIPLQHPQSCSKIGNPIDIVSGAKIQQETDYFDYSGGMLNFERSYNSDNGGYNYDLGLSVIPFKNQSRRCIAVKSQKIELSPITQDPSYCMPTLVSTSDVSAGRAEYWSADNVLYRFNFSNGVGVPVDNTNKSRLIQKNNTYIFTNKDSNTIYVHDDKTGFLLKKVRLDGRFVKYTYLANFISKITDNFQRTISLGYDGSGNLATLTDPVGVVTHYDHAPFSDLTNILNIDGARLLKPLKVTYADGSLTQYHWDEEIHTSGSWGQSGLLTGVTDANGDRYATFKYLNGKAIETSHAEQADRYTIEDMRNTSGVGIVNITDPLGTIRQQNFSSINSYSRPVGWSQPGGSGCNSANSAMMYDPNGNIKQFDDFNGFRYCVKSNAANQEETRLTGLTTQKTCPSNLDTYTTLQGDEKKIATQWHSLWNIKSREAKSLLITTWVYNGQLDPISGQITWCAPSDALLPDDSPIAVLCKKYEQPTSDFNGSLGFSASSSGPARLQSWTYNSHGQVQTYTNPTGGLASYIYYNDTVFDNTGIGHTQGDLKSYTNPAGHITNYTQYNQRGQVIKTIFPNTTVEMRSYHVRGWLEKIRISKADGTLPQETRYEYDKIGQLRKMTEPSGNWVNFSYDAAHRLIDVQDALGNNVHYTLDPMGNRLTETFKDAQGVLARTIVRTFDALNRLQSMQGVID